jgi:hypothetical protein
VLELVIVSLAAQTLIFEAILIGFPGALLVSELIQYEFETFTWPDGKIGIDGV